MICHQKVKTTIMPGSADQFHPYHGFPFPQQAFAIGPDPFFAVQSHQIADTGAQHLEFLRGAADMFLAQKILDRFHAHARKAFGWWADPAEPGDPGLRFGLAVNGGLNLAQLVVGFGQVVLDLLHQTDDPILFIGQGGRRIGRTDTQLS